MVFGLKVRITFGFGSPGRNQKGFALSSEKTLQISLSVTGLKLLLSIFKFLPHSYSSSCRLMPMHLSFSNDLSELPIKLKK